MLGNTGGSRMVSNTSYWTYIIRLIVWTRKKSHLHNPGIIWEDKVKVRLTLWISGPKSQTRNKSQCFSLLTLIIRISDIFKRFNNSPYLYNNSKQVNDKQNETYFILIKHITNLINSKRHV